MSDVNPLVTNACERLEALKGIRMNWDSLWQDVTDYVHPARGDFSKITSQGENNRVMKIFDGTAPWALSQFAAGLHGFLTPGTQRWFKLTVHNKGLLQDLDVRAWLELSTNRMYDEVFNSQRSKFISQSHEFYLDLGAYGTAVMFIFDEPGKPIYFKSFFLAECYIAENEEGEVDTLYRLYNRTAKHLMQKWGYDNLPKKVQKAIDDNKPFTEFECLHAIEPRQDVDPNLPGTSRNMPWRSLYILTEEKHVLEESGYREFPAVASRWWKTAGETYGRSPSTNALPDIKMLNKMRETVIRAAEKVVDPPMQMPDDGFLMPLNLSAAAINYYRRDTDDRVEPIITGGDIRLGEEMIDTIREQVVRTYHIDFMKLQQGPEMTATEVIQRTEDNMRLMSPMVGRQSNEYLGPTIERVFKIMLRRGRIPPIPSQLQGQIIDIDYVSPVAKAQKSSQLFNVTRMFEALAPLANIKPTMFDNVNEDGLYRWIHELLDAPMSSMKSPKAVALQRQQRERQAASMRQAEATSKIGPGTKALAEAEAIASDQG